jgi:hypothetical protein
MYCLIKLDKIEITFAKDIQIKPKFISFEKNRKTNKKRFQVKKKKKRSRQHERELIAEGFSPLTILDAR